MFRRWIGELDRVFDREFGRKFGRVNGREPYGRLDRLITKMLLSMCFEA